MLVILILLWSYSHIDSHIKMEYKHYKQQDKQTNERYDGQYY